MTRLALLLQSLIGSTLASVAVVAALVAGVTGLWPLLGLAAAGYLTGIPVSILVARRMQ